MIDERYPTGKFTRRQGPLTTEERVERIARIAACPAALRSAVAGLTDVQLDTPYREGGWSPRKIAHHIADSHANALIRVKLGLTEDHPRVVTYEQDAWATLPDMALPVEVSVSLVENLHRRWVRILETMTPEQFGRSLLHPEIGDIDLDVLLDLYAWHGHHHVTQIVRLRERQGWG